MIDFPFEDFRANNYAMFVADERQYKEFAECLDAAGRRWKNRKRYLESIPPVVDEGCYIFFNQGLFSNKRWGEAYQKDGRCVPLFWSDFCSRTSPSISLTFDELMK